MPVSEEAQDLGRRTLIAYCGGALVPLMACAALYASASNGSKIPLAGGTWGLIIPFAQVLALGLAVSALSLSCLFLMHRDVVGLLRLTRVGGQFDSLTGLPNESLFRRRLQAAIRHANPHGKLVAAGFLDLDHFKQINDSLGHSVGDALLQAVSEGLVHALRFNDSVARLGASHAEMSVGRLGGDEFAFLLTGMSNIEDVERVARRVLDAVRQPIRIAGRDLFVSATIGVAVYPVDTEDGDELLKAADTAMYYAKRRGRDSIEFFSSRMRASAERRLFVAERLRLAMRDEAFEVLYQPILRADVPTLVAAEALLRWEDPILGNVAPEEFIPVAEETGLIDEIGRWVLRSVCSQARAWQIEGFEPIRVAVNVSGRQIEQPNFPAMVRQMLAEADLRPQHLEFEITESTGQRDVGYTRSGLAEVVKIGVTVALDDFGTGCSALTDLRKLPIRRVKIDRSLVERLPHDPDDLAVVSAIIAMAHHLALEVVAEGVEQRAQAEALQELGCEELQGFLLSPPIPAQEFVRFLDRATVGLDQADCPPNQCQDNLAS